MDRFMLHTMLKDMLLARAQVQSVKKLPDINATYTPLGLVVSIQEYVGIAVD